MSEKEEDDILLKEEEEEAVPTRLSVQPPNIKFGQLRDYQMEGLNWLIQLHSNGLSGILADEMGLGKTLQSISLIAYLAHFKNQAGPHIVVVPLTTLGNWLNEFKRWCPSLRILRFHGNKEERNKMIKEDVKNLTFDVLLTSYEMLNMTKTSLKKVDWNLMIIDEAHRLKNETSLLSTNLRLLPTKYRLLLTGTPLQNNLHELWALLNFILPDLFKSSEEFDEVFNASDELQEGVLAKLHRILRPFMLRRLKTDVECSLKPKIETLVFVGMSDVQKDVYKNVLLRDIDALNGNSGNRGRLLNIVMQLRKAANHPYLFDGIEDMSLPPEQCEHLVTNSGKLFVLDKLLKKLKEQGSRVLIFCQMTRMLDILEDYLLYRAYEYCRIDGNSTTQVREEYMEQFNAPNSSKFCFLLSTRAGGLGINLQTADTVVLYDSDWNPQMDLQAQDRAHRIGQKKQVNVYRFVTEDSIEEKIIERAEIKLRLDAMVIQQGRVQSKTNKLNKEEMQAMIRFGASQVFRSSKGTTVTDEDIDAILNRGKDKTKEMNDKLQKYVGNVKSFSLAESSVNYYTLDGVDYSNPVDAALSAQQRELEELQAIHMSIPKRERRQKQTYRIDDYYREALTAPKAFRSQISRPTKLPKMNDFQFFKKGRIEELWQREYNHWEKYRHTENPPSLSGISEEEEKEKERLLAEGFTTWSRTHFHKFQRACERFGRHNVDQIAHAVHNKSPEEVRAYHKVFWERYKDLKNWERTIRGIEKGEMKLQRHVDIGKLLHREMAKFNPPERAYDELDLKYTLGKGDRGFSRHADIFLLLSTDRIGYGAWGDLRESIRSSPAFCFDYFLRSRSETELKRRVDTLIKLLERHGAKPAKGTVKRKAVDKKVDGNSDSKTANDAAAPGSTKKVKV